MFPIGHFFLFNSVSSIELVTYRSRIYQSLARSLAGGKGCARAIGYIDGSPSDLIAITWLCTRRDGMAHRHAEVLYYIHVVAVVLRAGRVMGKVSLKQCRRMTALLYGVETKVLNVNPL